MKLISVTKVKLLGQEIEFESLLPRAKGSYACQTAKNKTIDQLASLIGPQSVQTLWIVICWKMPNLREWLLLRIKHWEIH